MADILGIIPARYASTRFPGKPLARLMDKPMIQWVYERSSAVFEHLLVATDDQRIFNAVMDFGGKVQMTAEGHNSGTERCAEAARLYEQKTGMQFDFIVNIQGDEPLIHAEQLQSLLGCIQSPGTRIATLIRPLKTRQELENPNVVKVVVDHAGRALYFSRAPIPYVRNAKTTEGLPEVTFYTHIGLYAFQRETLEKVIEFPATALEKAESLEQLRWMENGIEIRTAVTHLPSQGVDTPEDLEALSQKGSF